MRHFCWIMSILPVCSLLFAGSAEGGGVQTRSGEARAKWMAVSDACFKKHLIDRYASLPEAGWKNDAMDYLRESAYWHQRLYLGLSGATSRRIAMSAIHYETAARLVERGCDWPYVKMEAAIWKYGNLSFGESLSRPALKAFKGVRALREKLLAAESVSPLERYLIAETAANYLYVASDFDVLIRAFVDLVRKLPPDNDTSVFLWSMMDNNRTLLNGSSVAKIIDSGAVSNDWFSTMLKGRLLYRKAWERRGGGWGYTVTKDRWRDYDELRKEAAACFERAAQIVPEVPFAYHQKMESQIGDALAGRNLLDRIISCDPEYVNAYAFYLWSCRPRWCGSISKMKAFGEEMLENGSPGSVMQLQYVHSRLSVAEELYERWEDAFLEEGVYSNMVSVVEAALKRDDLYVETKALLLQTLMYPAYANGDYRKMGDVAKRAWKLSPTLVCCNNYGIGASISDYMKTVGLAFYEDADGRLASAEKAMRDGEYATAKEQFARIVESRVAGALKTNALEYAASQVVVANSRLAQKGGMAYSLMPIFAPRFNQFSFWKTPTGRVVPTTEGWKISSSASMCASLPVLPIEGVVEICFRRLKKGSFILGMNIGAWNDFHPSVGARNDGTAVAGMCRHTNGGLQHWGLKYKSSKSVELESGRNVLKLVYNGRKMREFRTFINGKEISWLSGSVDERPERCMAIITAANVLIESIEAAAR